MNMYWLSLLLAEGSKSKPQQGTPLCLGLGMRVFTWIYRLLSICKLLVLVTHPLISLWVIFCSLCFSSSLRSSKICCSAAIQVHECLCLSDSSSIEYSQTGFIVLLGTITVKTLLFEGFFPVLWALIMSFPVHYCTVIVSLGAFLVLE